MQEYLEETQYVDFSHPKVKALAESLARGTNSDEDIAKHCFMYVRDKINHSGDNKDPITTIKASDVLKHGTGWCYSKAILLAALLRSNGIPTAFCYQRLLCNEYVEEEETLDQDEKKKYIYCLHGLNAIYLKDYGWYRVDARGNKEGVDAQFSPPFEQLAFEVKDNEFDISEIYEEPLEEVLEALHNNKNYDQMVDNFPDFSGKL